MKVEIHPTVRVARDITEILRLHQALIGQAMNHGGGPGIPGGEAMAALANVANVEAWDNQQQATERHELGAANYRRIYTAAECEDPDDAWSAYQLIEYWSEGWRLQRGDDYDSKRTIRSEANYLRFSLDWAWDNEPHWDEFAADVNRARVRLEDIVYDGKRVERTRVVCDQGDCEDPRRLIRIWSLTAAFDGYKCPSCGHRFTEDEFRRAHARMLASEGADRYVMAVEALATLRSQGRSRRTVQRWLSPRVKEVDRCTECGREYDREEWNVCTRTFERKRNGVVVETWQCGGELAQAWVGDREAVVLGYCEIGTRRTFLWWPDLWELHNATRVTKRAVSVA